VDKRGFLSCATSARSIAQSVRHQDRGGDAQASRPTEIAELKGRDQLKISSRCLGPLESQWHGVADANGRVLEETRTTSSRKLVVASCSWWPQRRPLIDLDSSRHRALTWMTAYFTLIRTGTAGTVKTAQPAQSIVGPTASCPRNLHGEFIGGRPRGKTTPVTRNSPDRRRSRKGIHRNIDP
jgi:hypothetical protein